MRWPTSTRARLRFRPSLPNLKSCSIGNLRCPWPCGREKIRDGSRNPPPRRALDPMGEMNITVQIPSALRRHTGGAAKVSCSASNLNELFSALDEKFPELKPHLRDDSGQIRRFLNVYVNEEDIRFLGGSLYAFQEGDEVLLVPSIAGGVV